MMLFFQRIELRPSVPGLLDRIPNNIFNFGEFQAEELIDENSLSQP